MNERQLFELAQGTSETTEGVVQAVDWVASLVTVIVTGVSFDMPWIGPAPWVGDRVRVLTLGRRPFAALIEGAGAGTAQTTTGGFVTVLGDDGVSYRYEHLDVAPANGARVALDHGRRVVLGTYATGAVEPPRPPEPGPKPPSTESRSASFGPLWSGNWRGGGFAGDAAETSTTRTAAYGYGTTIANTIPDAAQIVRAELHLVTAWDQYPNFAASMGAHGFDGRPGAMNDGHLSGEIRVPGGAGTRVVDIRGFADALKTGSALGVGFRTNFGWRQYVAAPGSGWIYMEWRV